MDASKANRQAVRQVNGHAGMDKDKQACRQAVSGEGSNEAGRQAGRQAGKPARRRGSKRNSNWLLVQFF